MLWGDIKRRLILSMLGGVPAGTMDDCEHRHGKYAQGNRGWLRDGCDCEYGDAGEVITLVFGWNVG